MKRFAKLFAGLLLLAAAFPDFAYAARLYFSPGNGSFRVGENFEVGVYVGADEPVNAMQGIVEFPTELLEAVSVELNGSSIVNLWVQKPSLSNAGETGNVRFEGVVLNPGFTGQSGNVVNVTFRVRKEGVVGLQFAEFAVLANDGLGTNVATESGVAEFSLLSAGKPSAGTAPTPELNEDKIRAVEEKIKSVEERMESMRTAPLSLEKEGVGFWEVLPLWVKAVALILTGAAALVVGLVIVSFGALMLVWMWNWTLRRNLPARFHRARKKISARAGAAKEEFLSDARFTLRELKRDYRRAEEGAPFVAMIKDFWTSVIKIVRRFFQDNVKPK